MGITNNITNALNTELASIGGLPTIYYPNVGNEPSQNVNYIAPTIIWGRTDVYTLSDEHSWTGIYQIDVYTQLKKGTSPILIIADTIAAHFDTMSVNRNDISVHVDIGSVYQPQVRESRWWCHVDIPWWCSFKP